MRLWRRLRYFSRSELSPLRNSGRCWIDNLYQLSSMLVPSKNRRLSPGAFSCQKITASFVY